jgi:rRNA maturation RNase YbeY
MGVSFVTHNIAKPKLRYKIISVWIKSILLDFDKKLGPLTYIFCNDEYVKDINVKYLAHDYYTDIITFDYSDNNVISGDMFISIDRVKENSLIFGSTYTEELVRVIVHGLLHLLGFKDFTELEKDVMRNLENECILKFIKLSDEYIK